jgi:hypothetical protein
MSDDDRAERLRNRRRDVKERASGSADDDEPSEPSKPDETDESDESGESGGVKEEHVGVYMYLPEDQKEEIGYQFDRLKAEYRRETGEELEKNREFYPLLIQYGLDSLDSWDGQDVKECLKR